MLLKDEYIDRIILERTALLDVVVAREEQFIKMQAANNSVEVNERKSVFTTLPYSSSLTYNLHVRASS